MAARTRPRFIGTISECPRTLHRPVNPRFLNVDLEIRSASRLDLLIAAMGERVVVLYSGLLAPHRHFLVLESPRQHKSPDAAIHALCSIAESLPPAARRLWDASARTFDVGYELRAYERSSHFTLRPGTLERIARLGASLGVTCYVDGVALRPGWDRAFVAQALDCAWPFFRASSNMTCMNITDGGLDDPRVQRLLTHHFTSARAETAPGSAHALDLSGLKTPDIFFWSAWEGDCLSAIGALKRLDDSHGEVKSMHTEQSRRRKGAGGAMLRHIIGEARAKGLSRLSLETGSSPYFVPARALYKTRFDTSSGS